MLSGRGLLLSCLLLIAPGTAAALENLRIALAAVVARDFANAAAQAQTESRAQLATGRDRATLQNAGLCEVVAAYGYANQSDTRAFAAWGRAAALFAEAGTTWPLEQIRLQGIAREYAARAGTASDVEGPAAPAPSLEEDISAVIAEQTTLLEWAGPTAAVANAPAVRDPITVMKTYSPRPFAMIDAAGDGDDSPAPLVTRSAPGLYTTATAASVGPDEGFVKGEPRPYETVTIDPDIRAIARTAWRYFDANFHPTTGLYNEAHAYPYTTVWSIASSIAALVSAHQLDLIMTARFNERIALLLNTLAELPLYDDKLPNRDYQCITGEMLGADGRPSRIGVGWSSVDVARLLIWLRIVHDWYPEFGKKVLAVVARFDTASLLRDGRLQGAFHDGTDETRYPEGHFGYEQYASLGLRAWKVPATTYTEPENLAALTLLGLQVPYDRRANAALTSEPFVMIGLEFANLPPAMQRPIQTVYEVQRRRWQYDGELTALSEERIDRAPWHGYFSVINNGLAWMAADGSGRPLPPALTSRYSTKAAFGWSALFSDDYSIPLIRHADDARDPRYGYFVGRYENGEVIRSLTANTNAAILASALYLQRNRQGFLGLQAQGLQRFQAFKPQSQGPDATRRF